jgi:SAM-dependent methyltransferase
MNRGAPFNHVFSSALRGHACSVEGLGEAPESVPVHVWSRTADRSDAALLELCDGPTLDIGCGPGRMTEGLAERGHVALGIDVVHEAVRQTRDRGVPALVRNVFDALPGEGRWRSALLADGNVGIGGDPVVLLARLREVLDPRGRVVVDVAPPGVPLRSVWATLVCEGVRSKPFHWAVVGVDDIGTLAKAAGFGALQCHELDGRWCAVLREAA